MRKDAQPPTGGKYTPDSVFIQLQAKCQVDLLSDARTAVSWIAAFHRNDGINDCSGMGPWGLASSRRLVSTAVGIFVSSGRYGMTAGWKA